MDNLFSINIKRLREQKGVGLRVIADAIGISAPSISNYEKGSQPPLNVANDLANYFGVSLIELMQTNVNYSEQNNEVSTGLLTKELTKELTKNEGTEALHSCKNEVSRLEAALADKEELIKELRARITDKEKMVSMLEKQLKIHESTQNQQDNENEMRKTG